MKTVFNEIKRNYEIIFLVLVLVGYVFTSSLSSFIYIENRRLFAVVYRVLVFLMSLFVLTGKNSALRLNAKAMVPLVLFWLFYFFKAVYSFRHDEYLPEFISQEYEIYFRIIAMNLVPSLALLSVNYKKINWEGVVKSIFWILFVVLTVNVLYTVFILDIYDKISGIFLVYYITSGHFGASLMLLSLYMLLFKTHKGHMINSSILLTAIGVGFFAVYISAARSPLLAVLLIVLYFVLLKRKFRYIIAFFGVAVAGILGLYFCREILHMESAFVERNYTAVFEGNASGRETFITNAIQIIKDNPIIGGRILFENGMYPHNVFLELLMAGGIVLLFLFLWIFSHLIGKMKYFLSFSPTKLYILPFFFFWLQYFILIQTSNNLHSVPEFWYFSSVVIGLSLNRYNEKIKSNDGRWDTSGNN